MSRDDVWHVLWDAGLNPVALRHAPALNQWQVVLPLTTDANALLDQVEQRLPAVVIGYATTTDDLIVNVDLLAFEEAV